MAGRRPHAPDAPALWPASVLRALRPLPPGPLDLRRETTPLYDQDAVIGRVEVVTGWFTDGQRDRQGRTRGVLAVVARRVPDVGDPTFVALVQSARDAQPFGRPGVMRACPTLAAAALYACAQATQTLRRLKRSKRALRRRMRQLDLLSKPSESKLTVPAIARYPNP